MFVARSIVLVTLPLLLAAAPVEDSSPTLTIPLVSRDNIFNDQGHIIPKRVDAHVAGVVARYARREVHPPEGHNVSSLSARSSSLVRRAPASTGNVELTAKKDIVWTGQIDVDGQKMEVEIDIETPHLTLFSTECKECAGRNFDPKTSKSLGKTFRRLYGDDTSIGFSGTAYTGTVSFSGFKITGQVFGVVKKLLGQYKNQAQGIIGLGRAPNSYQRLSSLTSNLKTQQKIKRIYGLRLSTSWHDPAEGCNSVLTVGGIDYKQLEGLVTYVPSVPLGDPSWWAIKMDSIAIGDQDVPSGGNAIFDTASPFIVGTKAKIDKLHDALGKAKPAPVDKYGPGRYTYPCDEHLPKIELKFKGRSYPFTDALVRMQGDEDVCLTAFVTAPEASPQQADLWIVGTLFLNRYYVVLDGEQNQVGFAERGNTCPLF